MNVDVFKESIDFIRRNKKTNKDELTFFIAEIINEVPDKDFIEKLIKKLKEKNEITIYGTEIFSTKTQEIRNIRSIAKEGIYRQTFIYGSINIPISEQLDISAIENELNNYFKSFSKPIDFFLGKIPSISKVENKSIYINWETNNYECEVHISRYSFLITVVWTDRSDSSISNYAEEYSFSSIGRQQILKIPSLSYAFFLFEFINSIIKKNYPDANLKIIRIESPIPRI
ncbi:MAG: hypothetical protein ACTSPY_18360 [Candidatus Helarchaeota archaeon]